MMNRRKEQGLYIGLLCVVLMVIGMLLPGSYYDANHTQAGTTYAKASFVTADWELTFLAFIGAAAVLGAGIANFALRREMLWLHILASQLMVFAMMLADFGGRIVWPIWALAGLAAVVPLVTLIVCRCAVVKTRGIKGFDVFSWLTLALVIAMLAVMMFTDSFAVPVRLSGGTHYRISTYLDGDLFGFAGVFFGLLLFAVSANAVVSDNKGFRLHWLFAALYLVSMCHFVFRDHGRILPFIPPLLAAASMATSFGAWYWNRKDP